MASHCASGTVVYKPLRERTPVDLFSSQSIHYQTLTLTFLVIYFFQFLEHALSCLWVFTHAGPPSEPYSLLPVRVHLANTPSLVPMFQLWCHFLLELLLEFPDLSLCCSYFSDWAPSPTEWWLPYSGLSPLLDCRPPGHWLLFVTEFPAATTEASAEFSTQ